MSEQKSDIPLTNAQFKEKLDSTVKDLEDFDELANNIEEQVELSDLEKQLNDSEL